MTSLRHGLLQLVLFIPPVLLLIIGLVHLRDGAALEAAFPVPLYVSADYPQPVRRYQDAAKALRETNPSNGIGRIALAEAMYYGDARPEGVWPPAESGLLHAPSYAQGWAFYAETKIRNDPDVAALALDQAFTLAPFDYFWAGRRAQIAARLWNSLNADVRNKALREVRILWTTPTLRYQLLSLLDSREGVTLLAKAYQDDPDTLRLINRWVAQKRREQLARQHT